MDLKTVYNIFTDCWKFYKKYHGQPLDDAAWELVLADGQALCDKYQNAMLLRDIVIAVIGEFERRSME